MNKHSGFNKSCFGDYGVCRENTVLITLVMIAAPEADQKIRKDQSLSGQMGWGSLPRNETTLSQAPRASLVFGDRRIRKDGDCPAADDSDKAPMGPH